MVATECNMLEGARATQSTTFRCFCVAFSSQHVQSAGSTRSACLRHDSCEVKRSCCSPRLMRLQQAQRNIMAISVFC
jgi:hypothetical protein